MDGRSILLAATLCLSFGDKKKFSRIQDFHNNGKKIDEVYNESINDFDLVIRSITCFAIRDLQPVMVKFKICSGFSHVSFSYVLRENKKKFPK